jgi:outer membrane protein assembly factor BamD
MGLDPGAGLRKIAAVLLLAALSGCAHSAVDTSTLASNSDRTIWEAAQKAYGKKQWDSARQYFKRLVDGFPNSEYGPGARLGLGQCYYEEGGTSNYILSVAALREFLTLYPSHPKAEFAQFLVGEAYYKQKNGPGRDASPMEKALVEYERLLDLYPSSPHVEDARNRIRDVRQSIARSNFLVGWFYQKGRQAWRAAILRYEEVVNEYPDYERLDEVLYRLSQCLDAAGRKAEALPHLDQLLGEYPQSPYADDAKKLKTTLEAKLAPAGAPADPPAATPPQAATPASSPTPSPAPKS